MKEKIILAFLFFATTAIAQNKIEKLQYGKSTINIPENCVAESETKINECNGFSASWFTIESSGSSMRKKTLKQIEEQIQFTEKREIKFNSRNQILEGALYKMNDGTFRYVGFGKIDEIPIMIIIGVKNEIKSNSDLSDFEKNFITI
ncbi:hypothetical protein [Flavobacterium sp. N1994]|uniref:hypothetical protein n=1 Tax=Flavobacterium sp. N1994 TaxID=2986827 RepID=UPI002221EE0F|nr:hypothetical protein [Flavobacterium sp. N1994]